MAVIGALVAPAYAEKSNTSSFLDDVTVVGSVAPATIADTASSVYYIDKEEVERGANSGKTVSQIISEAVPSLNVPTESRTNFNQFMRGRRVLVMIDGVSLNSSRGLSRQFDSITPFNIQHIEVLSGASGTYGGNATGGIINIVTKKGTDGELHGSSYVGVTSGFNNSKDMDYTLAQSLSGGTETVQGRVGLTLSQTNRFYDANGDRFIPDVIQTGLPHNRTIDISSNLSFQPSDTQNIELSAQYYEKKQDAPNTFVYGKNLMGTLAISDPARFGRFKRLIKPSDGFISDHQASTKHYQLNLNYSNENVWGNQRLLAQLSYRSEQMAFNPFPRGTGARRPFAMLAASQQNTDVTTLRVALVKDIDPVKVTYGVSASQESFDANQFIFDINVSNKTGGLVNKTFATTSRYPNTKVRSLSAFGQVEYKATDKLTLDAGYRHERIKNSIDDFVGSTQQGLVALGLVRGAEAIRGGSKSYEVSLFNVGAKYDLFDTQQMWARFAQGFELPDPAKYYGQAKYDCSSGVCKIIKDKYISPKNLSLDGIKTDSFELGWRMSDGPFSVQLAAYYSQSNKAVEVNYDTFNINVVNNKLRNYGIEAKANYDIDSNWSIGGMAHFNRSETKYEKYGTGSWQRSGFMYASAPKLGAYVNYKNDDWNARLSATSMLSINNGDSINVLKPKAEANSGSSRFDGYTVFDFAASYRPNNGKYGTVGFAVNNLFNKQYTTIWGQQAGIMYSSLGTPNMFNYKGRGRTFNLNYRYDF